MKRILICIFLCLVLTSEAQILKKQWGTHYPQISGITVCDMLQTQNGRLLVLVGYKESAEKGRNTEGVVLVADAQTGTFIRQKSFGFRGQKFNAFVRVAEALNKDVLLIGQSGNSKLTNVGWVVRVKPDLEKAEHKQFGAGGDSFFEQVVRKFDGTWGLFGQSNQKEGVLWVENKKEWIENPTNAKRLGKILAVASDTSEQWQIAGFSEYKLWWTLLIGNNSPKSVKSAYKPEIKAADIAPEQPPFFFGTSWKNGDADVWIAQVGTVGEGQLKENSYGDKTQDDYFHAATYDQEGRYFVAMSSTSKASKSIAKNKIALFDGQKLTPNDPLSIDLDDSDHFAIKGIFQGFNKSFWVFGDSIGIDGTPFARIVKCQLTDSTVFTAQKAPKTQRKGGDNFDNLFSFTKELSDESKTVNGSLEPNENGTLILYLTNMSGQPIREISVQAKASKWVGLDIELEQKSTKIVSNKAALGFTIAGKSNLTAGTATVVFSISINGQVRQELTVPLSCVGSSGGTPQAEVIYNNDEFNTGERSKTVAKPNIVIGLKAKNAPLPNPSAQPIVKVKSNRAKDNLPVKNFTGYANPTGNGQQIYPYEINLNLTEGENIVIVETDFGTSVQIDTLRILYNVKPNMSEPQRLHVIAIAPAYTANRLTYSDKDVREFAAKMRLQKGGLYSNVLVKEYTTPEDTRADAIKGIFRDLVRRCKKGYEGADAIGKRDIVMVFFSSHGKIISSRFKILPANFDDKDEEESIATSVDYRDDILEKLKIVVAETDEETARKVVVFIDACHSGGAKSKSVGDDIKMSGQINALNAAASGIMTLSSTTDSLLSYEDSVWENGAFTEGLLEALDNKRVTLNDGKTQIQADTDKEGTAGFGYLSLNEVFIFLQKRVPDLFLRHKHLTKFKQIPFLPIPDAESKIPQLNNQIPLFKLN
ncbi:MAG: caspase family protein [Saprospiraceae bacterium]|nr:caspase family protein [Saprospiraceae bacterium]